MCVCVSSYFHVPPPPSLTHSLTYALIKYQHTPVSQPNKKEREKYAPLSPLPPPPPFHLPVPFLPISVRRADADAVSIELFGTMDRRERIYGMSATGNESCEWKGSWRTNALDHRKCRVPANVAATSWDSDPVTARFCCVLADRIL